MTQFARPSSDQSAGSWTTSPLWSKIDEDISGGGSGDGTLITSDSVGNGANTTNADVKISTVTDPTLSSNHVIRVRWLCSDASRSLQAHIELWEGNPASGGTKRAEIISASNVGGTEVEASYTLSSGEADAITDYSNLYFRFWGQGTGGGPSRALQIEAAQFEVPDVAAPPTTVQLAFRGRNDDESESLASWKAAQNTNWSQPTNAQFRVRFEIEETAGGNADILARLEYNKNSAGWNPVNGSSAVVQSTASLKLINEDNTTNQLTASARSFVAGKVDESDGLTTQISINNQHTEFEFCISIIEGDVTNGDTIQLRVTNNGTALTTYTQTPSLTVQKLLDGAAKPVQNVLTTYESVATATSHTKSSVNVGSGSNRVLVVTVSTRQGPTTGVTFGGTALTKAVASINGTVETSIWFLINPSGTANVVITITSSGHAKSAIRVITGANQTAPIRRAIGNNYGFTGSMNTSIENIDDDLILDSIVGPDNGSGTTPTVGANQTSDFISGTSGDTRGASSRYTAAASALSSMQWTVRSEVWTHAVVAIRPADLALTPVSTTAVARIENLVALRDANIIRFENRIGLRATRAARLENNIGIRKTAQTYVESLVALRKQIGTDIESLIGLRDTTVINVESLQQVVVVTKEAIVNIESLLALRTTTAARLENLQALRTTSGIDIESLIALRTALVASLENLQEIEATQTIDYESITVIRHEINALIESLQALEAAASVDIESLLGILTSTEIDVESLIHVRLVQVIGAENQQEIAHSPAIDIENLAGLALPKALPVENLVGLEVAIPTHVESLIQLAIETGASLESLLGIRHQTVINVETLQVGGVVVAALINFESLQALRIPKALNLESLEPVLRLQSSTLEYLQGIEKSTSNLVESAQGIAHNIDLRVENITSLRFAKTQRIESLMRLAVARAFNLESLVGLLKVSILPLESLQGVPLVTKNALIPIESLQQLRDLTNISFESILPFTGLVPDIIVIDDSGQMIIVEADSDETQIVVVGTSDIVIVKDT